VHDGAVETVLVGHDNLKDLVVDHLGVAARLGVDIAVQVLDDLAERGLGLLLQVGDGNARGEDGIVGVVGRAVGSSFGRQVVELHGRDAIEDTRDDLFFFANGSLKGVPRRRKNRTHLHGNLCGVDKALVQALAKVCDAGGDLVESDALAASVSFDDVHSLWVL